MEFGLMRSAAEKAEKPVVFALIIIYYRCEHDFCFHFVGFTYFEGHFFQFRMSSFSFPLYHLIFYTKSN